MVEENKADSVAVTKKRPILGRRNSKRASWIALAGTVAQIIYEVVYHVVLKK
jgi:hypothetical protein